MAGSGGWVTSMRWAAHASRHCCRLQTLPLPPEPPAVSRTSCCLQSFVPSPELRAVLPPESSTSSRPLRPPPDPFTASRASYCLRSLRLPPGHSTSTPFDYPHTLQPPPDPSTSTRPFGLLQSLLSPPELPALSRASYLLPPEPFNLLQTL
jgi:hypothetical protein